MKPLTSNSPIAAEQTTNKKISKRIIAAAQEARNAANSERFPIALTIATRMADGVWDLMIPFCPNCGREHHHGGCEYDEPSLGHRVGHCGDHRGDYILELYK